MAQWWAPTNASYLIAVDFNLAFSTLNWSHNLLLSQGKIKHEEKGLFSITIIYSQAV